MITIDLFTAVVLLFIPDEIGAGINDHAAAGAAPGRDSWSHLIPA
jgi:hypothetical protein